MSLPKKYWLEDMEETKHFFDEQVCRAHFTTKIGKLGKNFRLIYTSRNLRTLHVNTKRQIGCCYQSCHQQGPKVTKCGKNFCKICFQEAVICTRKELDYRKHFSDWVRPSSGNRSRACGTNGKNKGDVVNTTMQQQRIPDLFSKLILCTVILHVGIRPIEHCITACSIQFSMP